MDINEAINYIFDGEAILFIGAGYSLGAVNQNSEGYVTANGLKERLGEKLEIKDTSKYSLPVISNRFIRKLSEEALIKFLKEEFAVKKYTPSQEIIAIQNWKRIYSANYDNIIEKITENAGISKKSVTPMDDADSNASSNNLIVHLNGYINQMTTGSLMNYTKLTNQSYASDTLKDSKWSNLFSLDLTNAKAVFFVGFSLNYDLDISRMITANKEFKNKTFFINGKIEDEIIRDDLEYFGNVTDIGTNEFANLIEKAWKEYIPKDLNLRNFLSFNEVKSRTNLVHIKDSDIMNLFFKGNFKESILQDFCNIESKYTVIRENQQTIIDGVNNNEVDLIMIHSSFGNGKTIFIESLKYKLVSMGKSVFIYNGNKSYLAADINKINELEDKDIVLIIEDYYTIKAELKLFIALNKSKVTVIVSGRSAIHFNTKDALFRNTGFHADRALTFSLENISQYEVDQLFKILDDNGLWGDKSYYNSGRKKQMLQRNAQRGFSNVMFEILKSNGMFERLGSIFDNIEFSSNKEIVISLIIVNVIRSDIQLRDILVLLDRLNLTDREANELNFKEFVDIDNNKIKIKSSIASREILKSHVKSDELLKMLQLLFSKANKLNINGKYDYFCRELVSFSNFKILFNGRDKDILNRYSLEYYESIKNTSFAKRNNFFWLQYAIQKLDQPDYVAAGVYFKNAYSYAENRRSPFDTYQIDTHYARYQLEKSIYSQDVSLEQSIENFKEAHTLLCRSNQELNKHYSIRHSEKYKRFFDLYKDSMSESQRLYLLFCCKEMLDIIAEYSHLCQQQNKKIEWYVHDAQKVLLEMVNGK